MDWFSMAIGSINNGISLHTSASCRDLWWRLGSYYGQPALEPKLSSTMISETLLRIVFLLNIRRMTSEGTSDKEEAKRNRKCSGQRNDSICAAPGSCAA
jgi:hypothetical protein